MGHLECCGRSTVRRRRVRHPTDAVFNGLVRRTAEEIDKMRKAGRVVAEMHAATSSAFTWMIGTSNPLAKSDAHRVERASSGSVVNPTWLFWMMWIVPPTV